MFWVLSFSFTGIHEAFISFTYIYIYVITKDVAIDKLLN